MSLEFLGLVYLHKLFKNLAIFWLYCYNKPIHN